MNEELLKQLSRRIAKSIASNIASHQSLPLGQTWAKMSEARRIDFTDAIRSVAELSLANALPQDDNDLSELIRELGRKHGYPSLVQMLHSNWADALGVNHLQAPTIGPRRADLAPCGCEDSIACAWCCGTGTLTHRVKACKDHQSDEEETPIPPKDSDDNEVDWSFNAVNMVNMIAAIRDQGLANFECAVNGPGILKGQERIIYEANMLEIIRAVRELGVTKLECPTSGPGAFKVEFSRAKPIRRRSSDEDSDGA